MILDLFLITVTVCFIVDLSGFVDYVKNRIVKFIRGFQVQNERKIYYRIKPFDCSMCMTWWCGLAYLIISGNFGITGIATVALFAYLSEVVTKVIETAKDVIGIILNKIQEWYRMKSR